MRPKERRDSGQNDLFRARLDQIVDMGHALAKLGQVVDWRFLEERFGAVYTDRASRPPLPTRLMAGLAILKHMRNLSDEELRALSREPVLPAVLRRGVLPAQADVRPLVADALAPADGRREARGADAGEPFGRQGDYRCDGAAESRRLSDWARERLVKLARKTGVDCGSPTNGWASGP